MKKKDLFWGLLLLLAAVLIIVNKFGFYTDISIFKIAATIFFVGLIVKGIQHISFSGILFPSAFLCILYAKQWNIEEITPWPVLLAALLGSIGLSLIFKKYKFWNHKCGRNFHNRHGEKFSEVIDQPDSNVVDCSVSFGSSMKYVNADNFEKANIKCSFGAMKVYFDNAIINSGSAEIFLDVQFGGVELYIPKTWNIINDVNTSLGAMEEKNRRMGSQSPVVTIRGNISFSGVEIIYI